MVFIFLLLMFAIGLLGQQLSSGSLLSERWRVQIIRQLRSGAYWGIFAVKVILWSFFGAL